MIKSMIFGSITNIHVMFNPTVSATPRQPLLCVAGRNSKQGSYHSAINLFSSSAQYLKSF